jgi:hypothetical protein
MADAQIDASVFGRLGGAALPPIEAAADWQLNVEKANTAKAIASEQRAKARKAEEERADELLIREIGRKHGGAPDKMIAELRVVNPRVAMKFDTDWADVQTKNVARATAESKLEVEKLDRNIGRLSAALANPALYPMARRKILEDEPDLAEALPETFDPASVTAALQFGTTAKDISARDAKSLEYLVKGDYHRAVGMALADPTMDAQEWETAKAALINNKVPREIVESYGQWTPDAWKTALQRGMTPDQRVDNERQAAADANTARHQAATEANAAGQLAISRGNLGVAQAGLQLRRQELAQGGDGPLQAVIGPDGQPVLVARRDAIGRRPAGGGASGGGRGVTSADAGRIAEFDTSIDDLGEVRAVLTGPGATGAVSGLEAATPSFVTDLTGYGTGAKQRQAVIDRVKQVIGKALEGGVLRKEDEYKYEKILPTIRDAAPIVKSKLDGLEAAIRKRRQTHIESLGDAGYDTAAYERRTPQRAPAGTPPPAAAQTAAPAKRQPKAGDIVKHNGKRYRVASVSGGAADLEPIE